MEHFGSAEVWALKLTPEWIGTDAQRDHPPAVGEWVTYRFRGVNESGVPRFASFVRLRPDTPR